MFCVRCQFGTYLPLFSSFSDRQSASVYCGYSLSTHVGRRKMEFSLSPEFPTPFVTAADVEALLARLYALRAAEITEYASYNDRTFYVRTAFDEESDEPTEFVFKVLNAKSTSHAPGIVAAQTDILSHLNQHFPQLKCQVPLATVDGKLLSFETIRNDWRNGICNIVCLSLSDFLAVTHFFFKMFETVIISQCSREVFPCSKAPSLDGERRGTTDEWCFRKLGPESIC